MSGSPFALAPVDTMADLNALLGSDDGDVRTVLGYHAVDDGGGGLFRYDGALSTTDNGGTIIAPNSGGGRWIRHPCQTA
jgi:hypothetical protein